MTTIVCCIFFCLPGGNSNSQAASLPG
uniref:Uncharacterized protein n=1 Tax=Anguilla anguilla TaxID=7936 RepID=A0A0E9P607_ANGAN